MLTVKALMILKLTETEHIGNFDTVLLKIT